MLIQASLEEKRFDKKEVIKIVNYYIQRNEIAYRSHRKTALKKWKIEKENRLSLKIDEGVRM